MQAPYFFRNNSIAVEGTFFCVVASIPDLEHTLQADSRLKKYTAYCKYNKRLNNPNPESKSKHAKPANLKKKIVSNTRNRRLSTF